MNEKEKTYMIDLMLPGNDKPVATFQGCTNYRTKPDHGTMVFTNAFGKEIETDLYFTAVVE